MPATEIRLFRDEDGSTPILEWLERIERRNRTTYEKCRSYLQRLADFGRELRRPTADYLRDGIYELRIKHLGVNYRILYGFVGQDIVLVSHGITKEKKVPSKEIALAAERMLKYRSKPEKYCLSYSTKDSSTMEGEAHDNEGQPVEPELQQFLAFIQFQNVSDLVYEVVSHAQDELITSPRRRLSQLMCSVVDGECRRWQKRRTSGRSRMDYGLLTSDLV